MTNPVTILNELKQWMRDNEPGGFELSPDEQKAILDHVEGLRLLLRETARVSGPLLSLGLRDRIEQELYPCSKSPRPSTSEKSSTSSSCAQPSFCSAP
jgi:hypothetical protein